MRPVTGLERPVGQWALVAGCFVLIGLLAGATVTIWRERAHVERLLAAQHTARTELTSRERELTRERAAREAFSLELARMRAQQSPAGVESAAGVPTLTLVPTDKPRPLPPEPTVTAPERSQTVLLRLVLPAGVTVQDGEFQVAARDWSTGRSVWSTGAARTATVEGRRAVLAHISGEMLGPGAYEVVLTTGAASPAPIAVYEVGVR